MITSSSAIRSSMVTRMVGARRVLVAVYGPYLSFVYDDNDDHDNDNGQTFIYQTGQCVSQVVTRLDQQPPNGVCIKNGKGETALLSLSLLYLFKCHNNINCCLAACLHIYTNIYLSTANIDTHAAPYVGVMSVRQVWQNWAHNWDPHSTWVFTIPIINSGK